MSENRQKNRNLNSADIRNKIIRYCYTSVEQGPVPQNITSLKDLDSIKNNDYLICPRFSGTRSWILFFILDGVYYAVNFPKHNQRKRVDLVIHPINISVNREMYNGTIMEGIYFNMGDHQYLIVDEVYTLSGQNQLLKPKDARLNELSQYLIKNICVDSKYYMYVSQYFNINKSQLEELYHKIKNDNKIQEIIFYPKTWARKVYQYTIIDSDLVDTIIKTSQFRMQKTVNPDVYNLVSMASKKIGLALIPNTHTSKMCRDWFKKSKAKELLVKCQLDISKNKWIPIDLVDDKEIVEV